ncbi:reprolysin-like metallopeptidase [Polaribacter sp.]|uniref:zinc-dependent metalloprotease n=1 Tax=Polaribacter sp. TaxID=1920175 RepID=UPI003EF63D1D
MRKIIILIFLCFVASTNFGQDKFWTLNSLETSNFSPKDLYSRKTLPTAFKIYNLDIKQITQSLKSVTDKVSTIVYLPTNNNKVEKFSIREASILAPALSAKYPMIKSYVGQGLENPDKTARFSVGTDGLHVVIFNADEKSFYIDPYTKNNSKYIAYSKGSVDNANSSLECLVRDTKSPIINTDPIHSIENADDSKLRKLRLALVCTSEYANFHLDQQGIDILSDEAVRKAAVLSAMNSTMTRVNGVFERDLGVRMELVADNDKLIFFHTSSDGLTNDNANQLINESQTKCDDVIGDANYDIGHTLSTGAGGLAGLGVVCITGSKARGVTGTDNPINDPYDIDFVAHEMGHQFGANHTFNNSCSGNRNNATAIEPGSGSTIMGYAGICTPNVQSNSDDHFHAISITEMWNNILSSATCATLVETNNPAPTANAGADYSIPRQTPFVLRGIGSDASEGNILTYNWEQIDPEIAAMPPVLASTSGPTFRSLPSSTSPDRYMPALATIISGETSTTWEVLPGNIRDMNFSLVVRDNNPGGGSSARDDVTISMAFGFTFAVTSQNSAVTWDNGNSETITWDVVDSDKDPINCLKVNIKLSLDGGLTFPITLASNTDNDGSETIVVPNNGTTEARIMVEAADNIFYNVNTTNFIINGAAASVKDVAFNGFNLYPNPSNGAFHLNFEVLNTNQVSVQLFDIRGRLINQKDFYNTASNFSEEINFSKTLPGLYLIKIINGNKQTTKKLVIE